MRPNFRGLQLNQDATASLRREPELPSAQINSSSPRSPFNPTYNFDSSMAVTIVILLTALFFMCFFSVYVRRLAEDSAAAAELSLRRRQRRDGRTSSTHGLSPSTVNALPIFSYDCIAKSPLSCVVCLAEFEEKETVKIIPRCGHVFHSECIDLWLSSHGSCPLCRSTQFFPSQGDVRLQLFDEMVERVSEEDGEGERASGEEEEEGELRLAVVRRCRSCSSIGKRVPLRRSCSF